MSSLADKIMASRRFNVEAAGFTFTVLRPTHEDAGSFRNETMLNIIRRFVIDWNLKEIDLFAGGSPVPVKFESDAFSLWLADNPKVWEPLSEAIFNSYNQQFEKIADEVKN
jgi:hypothetical protein